VEKVIHCTFHFHEVLTNERVLVIVSSEDASVFEKRKPRTKVGGEITILMSCIQIDEIKFTLSEVMCRSDLWRKSTDDDTTLTETTEFLQRDFIAPIVFGLFDVALVHLYVGLKAPRVDGVESFTFPMCEDVLGEAPLMHTNFHTNPG
jgi:hypothetical protein